MLITLNTLAVTERRWIRKQRKSPVVTLRDDPIQGKSYRLFLLWIFGSLTTIGEVRKGGKRGCGLWGRGGTTLLSWSAALQLRNTLSSFSPSYRLCNCRHEMMSRLQPAHHYTCWAPGYTCFSDYYYYFFYYCTWAASFPRARNNNGKCNVQRRGHSAVTSRNISR